MSWADLIALSGNVASESAGAKATKFCGGRTDAIDGVGSEYLEPSIDGNEKDTIEQFSYYVNTMGMTKTEFTALLGGGHTMGKMHVERSGFEGSWTSTPQQMNNEYFKNLLDEVWSPFVVKDSGKNMYKAEGKDLFMLKTDMFLRWDSQFLAISQKFAEDNEYFLEQFSLAWSKIQNADMFEAGTGGGKYVCL